VEIDAEIDWMLAVDLYCRGLGRSFGEICVRLLESSLYWYLRCICVCVCMCVCVRVVCVYV